MAGGGLTRRFKRTSRRRGSQRSRVGGLLREEKRMKDVTFLEARNNDDFEVKEENSRR